MNGSREDDAPPWTNWRAYYLFYHADRDFLLRHLLRPLVSELLDLALIDRFFFVRYGLGGPHVRIRWCARSDQAANLAEARLAEHVSLFFSQWPSTQPLSPDKIRAHNRGLLSVDEVVDTGEDQVYPDNSWHRGPLLIEVERYGGPERVDASLNHFCLSSVEVLEMLDEHAESGSGWVRAAMIRLALRLAWGLTSNEEEFINYATYAKDFFGDRLRRCTEEGERVFSRTSSQIVGMVRDELTKLARAEECLTSLAAAAAVLADRISASPGYKYIAASHIHMTANRLGLLNPDEVYLSGILMPAIETWRSQFPDEWRSMWNSHPGFVDRARHFDLAEMVNARLQNMKANKRSYQSEN